MRGSTEITDIELDDMADDSEETHALLQSSLKPEGPTPLPTQVKIVLLQQFADRVALVSIRPYINQLVSQLDITGGDKKKVGYYAGIIDSSFYFADAISTLQWSRASDYVGRKPILILCIMGTSVSMMCFGLSTTFLSLLLSRFICGLFNGKIGITLPVLVVVGCFILFNRQAWQKVFIGETTDTTNRARGFSLIAVVWAAGTTSGSFIGGSLVRPTERFPAVFTHPFWEKYAYFIPNAVASCVASFALIITIIYFKETNPKISEKHAIAESSQESHRLSEPDNPVPLREILTSRVVISVSNYMALVFLNRSINVLTPLFFSMPVEIGGLGLSPLTIGTILGTAGAVTGLYQAFFFSAIIRRFGERRIFILGIMIFIPAFLLFPVTSLVVKHYGFNSLVPVLITILLSLLAFMDMAYGCIYVYITASARNKRSLGATHGLSQTGTSFARGMGPVMATSLYSFSLEKNILYGYGVYAIFASFSVAAIFLAIQLPHKMWDSHEGDHEHGRLD